MNSLVQFGQQDLQKKSNVCDMKHSLDEVKVFWIQGNLTLLEYGFISFYIGCNGCNKTIKSVEGVQFQYLHCGNKNGVTTKRFCLSVEISDTTGVLETTQFTNEVYKLLRVLEICDTPDCVDYIQLNDRVRTLISQLHSN
ncbi:unnamed protein product [Cuscuta europaea]|uniref:Replication factor A C-terminal domain-containing protein n=1 Tax=Cuscuta europaea TaxID=41803 RepID=A0A9P0Z1N6_CUSEU|nr:unnamed protein product [Cuscuta europaea]